MYPYKGILKNFEKFTEKHLLQKLEKIEDFAKSFVNDSHSFTLYSSEDQKQ